MSDRSVRKYMFGDFLLEPTEGRLSRTSFEPVDLTGKPLEVLVLLVENHGRLVSREKLTETVWPGIHGSDESLTEAISRIRGALGSEQFIKTVRGKGYRFDSPVEVVEDLVGGLPESNRDALHDPVQDSRGRKRFIAGILVLVSISAVFIWIRHRSQRISSPLQRAIQSELKGDDDLALAGLRSVPESDSDFVEARLRGAWLSYQADKNDEAKKFLAPLFAAKLLNVVPAATRSKIDGISKLLDDQDTDALNYFQAAADAGSRDVEPLIWIGYIGKSSGDPDRALRALNKCAELDRWNALCGYGRVDALAYKGKFEEAIAEYNLLRRHADYPWLDEPVGYVKLAESDFSEARKHFEALAKNAPNSLIHRLAANDGLAQVDLAQGEVEEALRELEIARNSSDSPYEKADYSILIANLAALHGKTQQARQELEDAAARLENKWPDKKIRIAKVYAIIGDFGAARECLQLLGRIGADQGAKYGAAKSFVDGMESLSKRDFSNAMSQLEASMKFDPDAETAFFKGTADLAANNCDSAIEAFKRIVQNKVQVFSETNIGSLVALAEYELSLCYEQKRDETQAERHRTEAHALWAAADPEVKRQLTGSSSTK